MGIFFWLQIYNVNKKYRTALTITGLVTAIATYHYFRIFNSWNDAFDVKFDAKAGDYAVSLTGAPFNDAYRYVDWILTVPLLLIELILVMGLPAEETVSKSWTLGVASAVMVALGYPGEIQDSASGRWMWWFFAMIPFLYVVAELAVGLSEASQKLATTHGDSVASLTGYARWLTVISWLTYPLVDGWDYGSWSAVYNALSFGIAGMGSATIFFWLQVPNVTKNYRTALTITGLVTFIATYHYF